MEQKQSFQMSFERRDQTLDFRVSRQPLPNMKCMNGERPINDSVNTFISTAR